jgi:hypothetical protein
MGRLNSRQEQQSNLHWASGYKGTPAFVTGIASSKELRSLFYKDLLRYFALAALSRSTTAPTRMVQDALALVFRTRISLERSVSDAVIKSVRRIGLAAFDLATAPLYGCSKKQGISIRMPLMSCVPSRLCGAACYAHDVLDAAPASVVRGAVNGAIADWYEECDHQDREGLLIALHKPIQRMIAAARKDAAGGAATFLRRPRIRFAHVGEFAYYPNFANALASRVHDFSKGEVDCVIYTRHPDARLLDQRLFITLFTLDESSEDRRRFVPDGARVVRSAFGGQITETVDVNFLEHHRWTHFRPSGSGRVCPATAPETKVRTCDACRCDFCFTRPDPAHSSLSSDPEPSIISKRGAALMTRQG